MASDEILSNLEKGLEPSSPSTLPSTRVGRDGVSTITDETPRDSNSSLAHRQFLKGFDDFVEKT